jgi:hypothetical protein
MNPTKLLLLVLAALLLVTAFVLGTTDRFSGEQNCGAALFPKDTAQLVEQSGDLIDDDFSAEVTRKQCAREILRQRIFTAIAVVVAAGLVVLAFRGRARAERFPGDPIV